MTKKQVVIAYTSLSLGWVLLMVAIFSVILSGCTKDNISGSGNVVSQTRNTATFADVDISGPFEVHLLQEDTAAVEIKAEDNIIDVIETGVSNNGLFVRIRNHVNIRHHLPIRIYVHNRLFQRITFDGSGSLESKDTIHTSLFKYELNGSANASLLLVTTDLTTTINGSGNITMKGSAVTLDSDINGSGNIAALDMSVQNANITIRGSGEHSICAAKTLNANIYGSGNITYTGAAKVNADIKGSGKLIKL
ncbi:putative autotransporter adhesin-like protein [Chitinophaga niastensis]|uniref:Putative autotransporter adhesin-like protein n=2 Tax=Chitinophaga niastensis TaxID=536980 RepID=A0A2P8HRM8_CHINA|nr:putative autotransporter adhesin-like protein [Chitinophaga niastensis]